MRRRELDRRLAEARRRWDYIDSLNHAFDHPETDAEAQQDAA
jgi:hypothetical protein